MTDSNKRVFTDKENVGYGLAYGIAACAHRHQTRKGGKIPYLNHLVEVAQTLISYGAHSYTFQAGLLHDILEDTDVTYEELQKMVGQDVAHLVLEVTDVAKPEDGNRKARIAINTLHLNKASKEGATIKLADILSNTRDIVETDPDFAKVYLKEKQDLLPFLQHGDINLWKAVMRQLDSQISKLERIEWLKTQKNNRV